MIYQNSTIRQKFNSHYTRHSHTQAKQVEKCKLKREIHMQGATVTQPCYPQQSEGKHLATDDHDGGKSLPESRQRGAAVTAIVAEDSTSSLDSVHHANQALHSCRHFTSTLRVTAPCSWLGIRTWAQKRGRDKEDGGDGDSEQVDESRRKKKGREQVESNLCLFFFLFSRDPFSIDLS